MATAAIIDLISNSTANVDSTDSAKSYAGDSNDFENVFKSVKETYSKKEETSSSAANTDNKNNQAVNDKQQTSNDEENNVKDKKDLSNDDVKGKSEKTDNKVEDKTDNKTSKNEKTDTKQTKEPENEVEPKIEVEPEVKADTAIDPLQNTPQTQVQNTADISNNIGAANNQDIPVENIITMLPENSGVQIVAPVNNPNGNNVAPAQTDKIQIEPAQTVQNQPVVAQSEQPPAEQSQTEQVQTAQSQTSQSQVVQQDFAVDLSNLKNLDEIIKNNSNDSNGLKVQPQTQQVLSDLKINQPDASLQTQTIQISQPNTQAQQSSEPIATAVLDETNSQIQTPVIEVNASILTSNSNVDNSSKAENDKQNTKDILDKTVLTQDAINKTNAKVMNVEAQNSSNLNSNNFSNKQNAQEQVVKLSLENNSSSNMSNADLSHIADAPIQAVFDKTLDNVQIPAQTASTQNASVQHPKELNQTDILSQINNQLDIKKIQGEGTTKVNIILKPENLGRINLELVNSKEGLTAQITTNNAQVKELLDKNLDSLKDSIGSQGVTVNSVKVKVEETQKQSNDMSSFDNRQSNAGHQEFSNNTQGQNQNNFSSGGKNNENITNTVETETEADTEIEDSPSIEYSHTGQVDYKV